MKSQGGSGNRRRRYVAIIVRGLDQIPMYALMSCSMEVAIMGLTPAPTDDVAPSTSFGARVGTFPHLEPRTVMDGHDCAG